MSRESSQRPHADTERVLAALRPGDTVGVKRGRSTRYGTVVALDLGGLEVRYPGGSTETVEPWSAHRQDRVSPAEVEVRV